MTKPDGSSETFDSSIGWIACNLEYSASQWDTARNRASDRGIRAIPWIRLCHTDKGEDFETIKQRLSLLVATAQAWGENLILPNYEVEASTYHPYDVAEYLYSYADWDGQTGWSTLAWLQNDVDWTPFARRGDPALLQIFPADAGWPLDYATIKQKMLDCVWHARDKGFTYVGVTYQTYAGLNPSYFDCGSFQHSVFPGNLLGHGDWPAWFQ